MHVSAYMANAKTTKQFFCVFWWAHSSPLGSYRNIWYSAMQLLLYFPGDPP